MRSFQDTAETCKQSFISGFSVCMTVPLNKRICKIPLKIIIGASYYNCPQCENLTKKSQK